MKRMKQKGVWSEEETALLASMPNVPAREAVQYFEGRSESAIHNRRALLGIGRDGAGSRKTWTDEELQYLHQNSHKSYYQLAKETGRSQSSIANIMKSKRIYKEWRCVICDTLLTQQGSYCKEHLKIGKKVRFYRSRMKLKFPDSDLSDLRIAELASGKCVYCGADATGIDRVDSSKGYIEGNVVSCCAMCNTMKSDYSTSEWLGHIKTVLNFYKGTQA